ncbi:MAG: Phenylalanine--tRNA ligase alpha subunit [Hyphomicrobiaceae bacterium hypho_1]
MLRDDEQENLKALEAKLLKDISSATSLKALDDVRIAALGRKGCISKRMQLLKEVSLEQRKILGQALNIIKTHVDEALKIRRDELEANELETRLLREFSDITLPVRSGPIIEGRIHPISQVLDEIIEIFASMGFSLAEGPDIDNEDNCFTKLNIPSYHPARQDIDTFYLKARPGDKRMVLRPHTSSVQIRTMMTEQPPLRIIAPGRVYRCDSDHTHTPMFHQIEGLVIEEGIHLGHLKWCLQEFCKAFFEVDEVNMRFRASHFPFTEPSIEVDIEAGAIGKPGEWLEVIGSGMVHPEVLRNCGLNPDHHQGFAFGMGLDRIAMLKYGIPDLRDMFSGDLKWMRYFGFMPLDVPTLASGLSS